MLAVTIVLIILLTIASASFSLSEIAFFSLPASRVKAWRKSPELRKKNVALLLKDPQGLLVSIFFLNTVVNIIIQNMTSHLIGGEEGKWLLKVGIPFILVFIFGELFPKYLGLLFSETLAPKLAPAYTLFQKLFSPIRRSIATITYFFSRILFFRLKMEQPLNEEEVLHILETSKNQGILHTEESRLLSGYLSLEKKQARDIMTGTQQAIFYDILQPLKELEILFKEKRHFAVAVCRESFDTFLGIIDAKTYLTLQESCQKTSYPDSEHMLLPHLKRPLFLPETTAGKQLLFEFEVRGQEIALIVDEYGSISGIIERSDLLDAIYVPPNEPVPHEYNIVNTNSIVANGIASLEEISQFFSYEVQSHYHQVTIGGFLAEKMGSIPISGAVLREGPLFFRVLYADALRVHKVLIQKEELS